MAEPQASKNTRESRLLVAASLPMLLFLFLPCLALIVRVAPSSILGNLANTQVGEAILLSGTTTSISLLLTIVAGTPVAYLLARRRFPGRAILDTLIDLPIVLPPSVAGIALLMAFGRRGLLGDVLGSLGISIPFTQAAVILAQLFVSSPLYIKAAQAGFASVDREYEQAAAIDGASRWKIFRVVTVPLSLYALAGGAVMAWARALGEFGATIIFAGNFPGRTQTMPLAIYIGFEIDLNIALTLALILLVVSFIVLAVVKGFLRRRLVIV
ncbi:MAG TPA: ABC transporter permease [Bacteroidota bacterium]|jgi:molybdate transport system permease protein|nr:ABC transporter permease [Bacteroidota bacterium]